MMAMAIIAASALTRIEPPSPMEGAAAAVGIRACPLLFELRAD